MKRTFNLIDSWSNSIYPSKVKNILFYSFLLATSLVLVPSLIFSTDLYSPCKSSSSLFNHTLIEARVACFHPTSKKVRRIYDSFLADYQLEISKSFKGFFDIADSGCFFNLDEIDWKIWSGVCYLSTNGKSIGFHDKTNLQLIPINLGIKISYPFFYNTSVFIGAAASYSLLRIHDDSNYLHEHVRKGAWGGLVQSGVSYRYCENISFTAFFDYSFQRFNFSGSHFNCSESSSYADQSCYVYRSDLNMSGYKTGVAVGFYF